MWLCERGDSNSHLFRDRDLNPARLPVPPRSPSGHCRTGRPSRPRSGNTRSKVGPMSDLPNTIGACAFIPARSRGRCRWLVGHSPWLRRSHWSCGSRTWLCSCGGIARTAMPIATSRSDAQLPRVRVTSSLFRLSMSMRPRFVRRCTPIVIAGAFRVFGTHVGVAQGVNVLFGCVAAVLAALIGNRISGAHGWPLRRPCRGVVSASDRE